MIPTVLPHFQDLVTPVVITNTVACNCLRFTTRLSHVTAGLTESSASPAPHEADILDVEAERLRGNREEADDGVDGRHYTKVCFG